MDDLIKGRVHLIVYVEGTRPFSFRTDVLVPVKDAGSAFSQALVHLRYSLEAASIRHSHVDELSIDWIVTPGG